MDKQTIIDFIQQVGKAISRYEWGQYSNAPCGKSTVSYTFGSWRAAMEAAGYKPIRSPNKPIKECLICGKPTKRTYCSRACGLKDAARFTRRYKRKCLDCGMPITSKKKSLRCPSCAAIYLSSFKMKTKAQAMRKLPNGVMRPYGISSHARNTYKVNGMSCIRCGYNKHVQACHIKPVCDFPDDALLIEVNSPNNITVLCPNCHWELDHGMLDRSEFKSMRELLVEQNIPEDKVFAISEQRTSESGQFPLLNLGP